MTSDDEIEEPVSPPACSKDDYPGLVLSGERETSNRSFKAAQVTFQLSSLPHIKSCHN